MRTHLDVSKRLRALLKRRKTSAGRTSYAHEISSQASCENKRPLRIPLGFFGKRMRYASFRGPTSGSHACVCGPRDLRNTLQSPSRRARLETGRGTLSLSLSLSRDARAQSAHPAQAPEWRASMSMVLTAAKASLGFALRQNTQLRDKPRVEHIALERFRAPCRWCVENRDPRPRLWTAFRNPPLPKSEFKTQGRRTPVASQIVFGVAARFHTRARKRVIRRTLCSDLTCAPN